MPQWAVVGALTLLAFILFTRRFETDEAKEAHGSKKDILIGGILCGLIITIAMNIQQIGMEETAAGKAGFLASLYILVVPVVGIFFKKKIPLNVWIGVLIGTLGLYFLCVTESFTIQKSDTYVLVSAFMFSMHILVIDHFLRKSQRCLFVMRPVRGGGNFVRHFGFCCGNANNCGYCASRWSCTVYRYCILRNRLHVTDSIPEGFKPDNGVSAFKP